MDKKKLEAFKKRLETRQQELRRNVFRTQQDGRSSDEDSAQDIAEIKGSGAITAPAKGQAAEAAGPVVSSQ